MSKNTGGYAFPVGIVPGMNLRDYFAAKAMQGLLSSANFSAEFINEGHIFSASYKIADAMIKEREK